MRIPPAASSGVPWRCSGIMATAISRIPSGINLLAFYFDSRVAFRLRDARVNEAERNGVAANSKGAPLFCDGLGHAKDSGLGSGIVELPSIAVQAGSGRNVDDNFVRFCAGTKMRGKGADEPKGSSGVAIEPDGRV